MNVGISLYGNLPDGKAVYKYTMENNNGMKVSAINIGGAITNIFVPDKNGNLADIALAHDSLDWYIKNPGSLGILVGRNSNRIKNATIDIFGKTYKLNANKGDNHLHGGFKGMQTRYFDVKSEISNDSAKLIFAMLIPDMDDDFPGNLNVNISYTLTDDNALVIDYNAVCDNDTIINMTNHSYFNLAGHDSGSVLDHVLEMNAEFFTATTESGIPSGEVLSVKGTPFDFCKEKAIGQDINSEHEQVRLVNGYDHNFMLNGSGYRKIATLTDPKSGRVMTTYTDLPCVQLYTANNFPIAATAKDNADYKIYQGVCLETQTCPNAAQMPWLKSPIYAANTEYKTTTVYKFTNV